MRQQKSYNLFLAVLILLAAVFILFAPSYGWKLRTFLSPPATPSVSPEISDATVAAENQTLKAQLAVLQAVSSELPNKPVNYMRAMVYSRYPMNFKNEMLVNVGSNDGATIGKAVVFQGILIGQVEAVFPDSALVMTVFDNRFKLPVRVGKSGLDGLLQGGSYPTVKSIVKTATLAQGDIVYAAASSLSYGLPVGEIMATSTSLDSLFLQATLNFAYDMNGVETVLIAK